MSLCRHGTRLRAIVVKRTAIGVLMGIVTISASYAAGGSQISPRVASRLGVPFIDRIIPVSVSRELGITVEEAEAVAQDAPNRLWSLLAGMSVMPGYLTVAGGADHFANERQLIEQTEAAIRRVADSGSCVILGRAAAVVLAGRPDALHVRLDGSIDGRVEMAMRQHGIDRAAARAAQKENDRIRCGYVEHFYRVDSTRPGLYHLVLDTVRLGWERAEQLIVFAARVADAATAPTAPTAPTADTSAPAKTIGGQTG